MQVTPKNDDIRRILAHPTSGKFRAEGSSEWPDDAFTNRRIADGDITKVENIASSAEGRHSGTPPAEKRKFARTSAE
jgi:hypothetical protein